LAWSPDSTRLLMGWNGGGMRVWDLSRQQTVYSAAPFGVRKPAWSPDGRLLAIGAVILDASDGRIVHHLTNHRGTRPVVRWSPDGRRIAVGNSDGVWIYDAATADLLLALPSGQAILDLAWSPDGRR